MARTQMGGNSRCIGGLAEEGMSVRLLTSTGDNYDTSAPFQIGQIWNLRYTQRARLVPPHVEDVLVTAKEYLGDQTDLHAYLLARAAPWRGGIDQVFGGRVRYTGNGNGYVCERIGIPDRSTGFWIPDRDLHLRDDGKHYDYGTGSPRRGLSYVGEVEPIDSISAGTLVRVSLARWWRPPDADPDLEERCYLQLSGWF
ncbi:MAG: hypothetical protein Kow0059_07370 [Candidatus Sumerlaeia bacterium]